jgi:hypothetical protein
MAGAETWHRILNAIERLQILQSAAELCSRIPIDCGPLG